MYLARGLRPGRFAAAILLGISLPLFLGAGVVVGLGNEDWIVWMGTAVLLGTLSLLILRQAYLGIVITMASLPLVAILPPVPFATSSISLLGGVTLLSALSRGIQKRGAAAPPFPGGLLWGLLFVAWLLISKPAAALLPAEGSRNWLFTFVQLWILATLAWRLLDTPRKHHVLMWAFSLATLISAVYAIQEGVIGESIPQSVRGSGLAAGANTAARYFVVGLVLLHYLRGRSHGRLLRFALLVGIAVAIFGTLHTVSRTGMLLLIGAIGLFFVMRVERGRQGQAGLVLAVGLGVIWIFADNILLILQSIVPSIMQASDTIGLRYALLQTGLRMWADNVVQGIGIGQFSHQLLLYGGNLLPHDRPLGGAHNMYIQVLAETGLVGLILFLGMLASSWGSLWRARRSPDPTTASLAQAWLIVLAVLLLGGITKHDHFDKLLWLATGVGMGSAVWRSKLAHA